MANSTSKPPKHDFAPAWLKVPDKEAPQTPRVRTSHAAGRRSSLADHVDARRSPCHTSVEQNEVLIFDSQINNVFFFFI